MITLTTLITPTTLDTLEAVVWSFALLAGVAALSATLSVTFPNRSLSLAWECALVMVAALLAAAALRRVVRASAPVTAPPRALISCALRLLLVLPWLFTLVVAAAGFTT